MNNFYKNETGIFPVAIFASGTGSNAKKIIEHFRLHASITVTLVVCNNPKAGVMSIAEDFQISTLLIDKHKFLKEDAYAAELEKFKIKFIVLAGFLWKIPDMLINAYRNRIVNIHPALLPKFGGKGMYGSKVHEAVIAAGEKESGITIHYVDEKYDHGDIIFRQTCPVFEEDTADTLAKRIHRLEHENYAKVVEECITRVIH